MVDAVPNTPVTTTSTTNTSVKPATPDLIVFNDAEIPVEFMTDLMFEQIGGQEVIGVSRNDLVNGQKVTYSPIKNLSSVGLKYNSQNIFNIPSNSLGNFNSYALKLEDFVPLPGTGTGSQWFPEDVDLAKRELRDTVYIDSVSGDLVVNVTNMSSNEDVEIQVLLDGKAFNDIMY